MTVSVVVIGGFVIFVIATTCAEHPMLSMMGSVTEWQASSLRTGHSK